MDRFCWLSSLITYWRLLHILNKTSIIYKINVQANSESVHCCLYLSLFLKYLACNFDDLEPGLFKVIQCYWPSNLLFLVRCVISNLRKIGQKLQSLSRAIGTSDRRTDRQTNTQVILYLANAMNCIGQTTSSVHHCQICYFYCTWYRDFSLPVDINSEHASVLYSRNRSLSL